METLVRVIPETLNPLRRESCWQFSPLAFGVFGLAGLLVLVGVTSELFFKRIDNQYSQLVARTAADINHVHDIAYHSGISFATILELVHTPDPGNRNALLATIASERAANDRIYENFARVITEPVLRSSLENVIATRAIFRTASDSFILEFGRNSDPHVTADQIHRLQSSFIEYQKACDLMADHVEESSLRARDAVDVEVSRLRMLLFGLGLAPVLVAVILVLLMVYLIRATPAELDLN